MAMFTLTGSSENDLRIVEWMADHQDPVGRLAADWFRVMRTCGPGISELLHDNYPTVCLGDYPFAYVGAFKAHVNVGFFHGASLPDPTGLLEGTGKRMRHVKLKPETELDAKAITALIGAAYDDIRQRINNE